LQKIDNGTYQLLAILDEFAVPLEIEALIQETETGRQKKFILV
jgi:hypothetical protein